MQSSQKMTGCYKKKNIIKKKKLLHSPGLVYKSMRGMVTNSIDRHQWLNVTSESLEYSLFFIIIVKMNIITACITSFLKNVLVAMVVSHV
jgi:hypothetical protein